MQIFAVKSQMRDLQTLMQQLRQHGCRLTKQRLLILKALCELDGHASVERVYGRIAQERQKVDLSTVYRTLEKLRDLHILSQTDLGRGRAEYELLTDEPHHHLVCEGCGRVIDLDHAYLSLAAEAIERDLGFRPILAHHAIFGLCRECQEVVRGGAEAPHELKRR